MTAQLGDVKASVFCNVSARPRHFVNVGVIFLPSVCDSFCVSTFSLGQRCRNVSQEIYDQSMVVFCRSGRDVCLTIFSRNSTVFVRFGLHANIVEEYVLLSALLHDQCCLQPFSRTIVCKGGSFHVHVSTRFVSPSLCYVAVSRARENNWDKPLLDDIIIDCLCHYCKILIHGHSS